MVPCFLMRALPLCSVWAPGLANVPLLAGSDAVGPPGVLPLPPCNEGLSLLVQAGLLPYEALRTATVNAATYLDAEQEFGKIAAEFRADLVLPSGNPLRAY